MNMRQITQFKQQELIMNSQEMNSQMNVKQINVQTQPNQNKQGAESPDRRQDQL